VEQARATINSQPCPDVWPWASVPCIPDFRHRERELIPGRSNTFGDPALHRRPEPGPANLAAGWRAPDLFPSAVVLIWGSLNPLNDRYSHIVGHFGLKLQASGPRLLVAGKFDLGTGVFSRRLAARMVRRCVCA